MHTKYSKQAIGMQVTFILKNRLQKEYFFNKLWLFFWQLLHHIEPLLGWECAYVWHDLRTKKEGIYVKKREYEISYWHTLTLQIQPFFSKWCVEFEPLFG